MSTASTMFVFGGLMFALWIIAAMLLRLSCMLNSVPRPRLVGAAMLMLVVAGSSVAAHAALAVGMGMTAQGLRLTPEAGQRLLLMLGLPAHMLVAATAYRIMLPTTFGRAMSVWIVQTAALILLMVGFNMVMMMLVPAGWMQLRAIAGI